MSKYKVGDVIKLRDDLEDGEHYGSADYLEKMGIMKNKPITILTIPKLFKDCYEVVDETGENWFLSDEMIEGLWEECKEKQDKLKLIDILNKIANGELKEDCRTEIKMKGLYYKLFACETADNLLTDLFIHLNEEVELIEPPCEHEWKDIETHRIGEGLIKKASVVKKCGLEEVTEECVADIGKPIEPTKIEELEISDRYYTVQEIIGKLIEVIRKVNAQTEVILAHRKGIDEIKEQLDY